MASVEIEGLVKYFGNEQVLHDVDVSIKDGEFVVLVGPSGCGKSTMLRMIAGLEEISGGTVAIDGAVVNQLPPKQRDLAMVFQSYALYPHMTVAENMGFSLRLARLPKVEIDRSVERVAAILDLTDHLDRYPRHLSGGQRQRVAMGRAIVRDPKVFLFDEPLSNLDAKLRGQMRSEIKDMHRRLGTTMIYVTHDQTEAMTMADKIVVLRDGRVEQIGAPMELFNDPENIFVAGFIGSPSMNFLSGIMRDGFLELKDGSQVRLERSRQGSSGKSVQLGVRPRHLRVSQDYEIGLPFEVTDVDPTGDEVEMKGILCGEPAVVVCGAFQVAVGDKLRVEVDERRAHLFGSDTGQRVN